MSDRRGGVWPPALRLGALFPNLSCSSTHGPIPSTHTDFGSFWVLLVAMPTRRNAVSATELAELERLKPHFAERNCKLYVLTCASARKNKEWLADVHAATGYGGSFSRGMASRLSQVHGQLPAPLRRRL
jgi:alkyl hydroperoxide reductase subunit AhpC